MYGQLGVWMVLRWRCMTLLVESNLKHYESKNPFSRYATED